MNSIEAVKIDRRGPAEIAAVLLTGGLFLVFENILHLKIPFLIGCTLLWVFYLATRLRSEPGLARDWGLFRRDTLSSAIRINAAVLIAGAALLAGYRMTKGWIPLPVSSLALFAAYPAWAFIQQFVLQALLTSNLEKLEVPRIAVIPISSILFGLVHLPDWRLAIVCGIAGTVFTAVYLRTRNLVPLAITHAWLGALTYYWILERDPWLEMVPR